MCTAEFVGSTMWPAPRVLSMIRHAHYRCVNPQTGLRVDTIQYMLYRAVWPGRAMYVGLDGIKTHILCACGSRRHQDPHPMCMWSSRAAVAAERLCVDGAWRARATGSCSTPGRDSRLVQATRSRGSTACVTPGCAGGGHSGTRCQRSDESTGPRTTQCCASLTLLALRPQVWWGAS